MIQNDVLTLTFECWLLLCPMTEIITGAQFCITKMDAEFIMSNKNIDT